MNGIESRVDQLACRFIITVVLTSAFLSLFYFIVHSFTIISVVCACVNFYCFLLTFANLCWQTRKEILIDLVRCLTNSHSDELCMCTLQIACTKSSNKTFIFTIEYSTSVTIKVLPNANGSLKTKNFWIFLVFLCLSSAIWLCRLNSVFGCIFAQFLTRFTILHDIRLHVSRFRIETKQNISLIHIHSIAICAYLNITACTRTRFHSFRIFSFAQWMCMCVFLYALCFGYCYYCYVLMCDIEKTRNC